MRSGLQGDLLSSLTRLRALQHDAKSPLVVITDECVAFRGTNSVRDLLYDVRMGKRPFRRDARVHAGFYDAYHTVAKSMPPPCTTKIVAGYSLGASLALLYALDMALNGCPPERVFCLGGPRVGDRAFRALYNAHLGDRTIRFDMEGDVVTELPPRRMGYCHVGQRVSLSRPESRSPFVRHSLTYYDLEIKRWLDL